MGIRNVLLWMATLALCTAACCAIDTPPRDQHTSSFSETEVSQPWVIESANLRSGELNTATDSAAAATVSTSTTLATSTTPTTSIAPTTSTTLATTTTPTTSIAPTTSTALATTTFDITTTPTTSDTSTTSNIPTPSNDISDTSSPYTESISSTATSEVTTTTAAPSTPACEAPSAVEDLAVNDTSSYKVSLSWTAPNSTCEVLYYNVSYSGYQMWGDNNSVPDGTVTYDSSDYGSEIVEVDVTGLKPYSWYEFQVVAVTDAGPGDNATIDAETTEALPSEPQEVIAQSLSPESIKVTWMKPEEENGILGNYIVTWSSVDRSENGSADVNGTQYTISDLTACVEYYIEVQAQTGAGYGNASNNSTSTDSEAPPQVTNLTNTSATSRSISLKWERPQTACKISRYTVIYEGLILWSGESDSNETYVEVDNDTDVVNVEIMGLTPYAEYNITVVACTEGGDGDASDILVTHTEEAVPSEPLKVIAQSLSPASINVTWEKPEEENGILRNYNVSWSSAESQESGFADVDDTQYTIPNLTSCVEYYIEVQAQTGAGYGDASNNSASTKSEVPPEVVSLNVTSVSSQSISLSWGRPDTECEITEYIVTYAGLVLWDDGRPTGSQSRNVTGNLTEVIEVDIDDLVPYTAYDITVVAVTVAIPGNPSHLWNQTTDEDLPSEVRNVTAVSNISTTIDVSWVAPENKNGELLDYLLEWYRDSELQQSVNVSGTSHVIEDLTSCVLYDVVVTAQTSAGCGNESSTSTTTYTEVPPEVVSLKVTSVSNRSISLSWGRPDTECEIREYNVTYAGLVLWDDGQPTGSQSTTVNENLTDVVEVDIVDLVPYTEYNITVVAVTFAGPGNPSHLWNQTTDEDLPSEVRNVTAVSNSPTMIDVSWVAPEKKNGELLDYLLEWYRDSELQKSVNVSGTSHVVEDLTSCVLYDVVVTARTSAGYGNESSTSTTTDTEVPPEATAVKAVSKESTSILLSWDKPDTACHITEYVVTYEGQILWEDNSTYNQKNFSNGDDNGSFEACIDDLIPYTEYTIVVTAATEAGTGDDSAPLNVTTLEDAPSPPIITSVVPKHKTLEVKWKPPEMLNGVITQYGVVLYRGSSSVKERNISATASHFTFEDLEYKTSYNVTLEAWTGGGVGSSSKIAQTAASPAPAIVGSVFGVLVVLIIVVLAYIKRDDIRKLTEKWRDPQPYNPLRASPANGVPSVRPPTPPDAGAGLWRKIANLQQDEGALLSQEFSNIQGNSHAGTTEAAAANSGKNRFVNILAYDTHRVLLGENKSYINANYIKNYDQSDFLIAAQGPLASTVGDWWQMILEQKATYIIMLTNCIEKGKKKCHQYWPDKEAWLEASSSLYVYNEKEERREGYVIRHLSITDENGYLLQNVKQYHFTTWPDFGVPDDPAALLTFVSNIKEAQGKQPLPPNSHMVVHCSAGVGRTGTFICVWNLCHKYKANGEVVDVPKAVLAMRERRTNMVQTKDQLLFVYRCYAEYASHPGRWPLPDSWEVCRAREFDEITRISPLPFIPVADRDDSSLVRLQKPPGFINARFVKDYLGKPSLIAAQAPTKEAVQHWWQMVIEQNVAIIVMLTNCVKVQKDGVNYVQYWPKGNEVISLSGGGEVVRVGERTQGQLNIRTFRAKAEKEEHSSRTVVQYHFQGPSSPVQLLELVSAVKTAVIRSQAVSNSRVAVHCSSGFGETGCFIAVWNLCHKHKRDRREQDVKREVLSLRNSRALLVETKEEYMFVNRCYDEFKESPEHWSLPDLLDSTTALYENIETQPSDSDTRIYENGSMFRDRAMPASDSRAMEMKNLSRRRERNLP